MNKVKKFILIPLIFLSAGITAPTCKGQVFWLGVEAGGGLTWFSNPGDDSIKLSPGAGASFGFFIRYGNRPYYQLAAEWLYSTNQMNFQVKSGATPHDNLPFHSFRVPFTVGYEFVHLPKFKWRAGGGMFIGTDLVISSNDFEFTRQDIRNPQYGLIGETGIQYLNFLLLFDYNYSINRFFSKDADTYGYNVHSHLQIFSLKIGMQF